MSIRSARRPRSRPRARGCRAGALAVLLLAACRSPAPATTPIAVPAQPPAPPAPPAPRASSTGTGTGTAPRIALLSTSMPTCGLDAEGREWTWNRARFEPTEAKVPNARTYACAGTHACATTNDGEAFCWGNGGYGKLGNGTEAYRDLPTPVVGITNVADIGVDNERTCARSSGGDVYCWGDSEFGKAGDGRLPDNVGREKLLPGKAILSGAATLAVGSTHACSVLNDARLSCWGQNHQGSVGQPLATRYVPRPAIVPKSKDLAAVTAGSAITCTISTQGAVACFGQSSHVPAGAVTLPDRAIEVAIGWSHHACARLASGTVMCWGDGEYGALGDGTTTVRTTPVEVKGLRAIGKATRIAADGEKTCALLEGGRVFCWGKEMIVKDAWERHDALAPIEIQPPER